MRERLEVQESKGEEIVAEMKALAAGAERASAEEFQALGRKHPQFGNNFEELFLSLKEGKSRNVTLKYLERAEALGDKWQEFLARNQDLLTRINSALDDLRVYEELTNKLIELGKARLFDLADKVSEDLQIERIGMAAWDKLNPLLEEAAAKMKEQGIDPTQFFS